MRIWLALSLLMSFQALGEETLNSWQDHKRASLTWSARGVTGSEEGLCRHPSVECRKILVEVRNDRSDAPIYCGASIMFPKSNAYSMREKGWQDWIPVEPGKIATVNSAWVPKDLAVEKIHTECHARAPLATTHAIMDVTDRPPAPPPPPVAPCSTRIQSSPDPDAFYPPAARAEEREGAPMVRAVVRKGQTAPQSIVLVTSSGQPDLDEAALQVAKAAKYTTTCEEGAVAFKVKFAFVDAEST